MITRILALGLLTVVTGCMLPPNVAILLPEENGTAGKAQISNPGGTVALEQPYRTVGASAKAVEKPFFAHPAQVEQEFGRVLAATPRPPVTFFLYFVPNEAVLDPASSSDLDAMIGKARLTPNADISVVGHADATGSDAVNIKISRERAVTIRDKMVGAGVAASIIEVTSHGSSNPRVPSPPGVPEPRNRRVEVTIR